MKQKRVFRPVRAVLWTASLMGVLYVVDRVALGPRRAVGWKAVSDVDAVPADVGPVIVPAYLPRGLSWPPAQVWARGDQPGWWVAVTAAGGDRPRLWIGTGQGDPPEALGDLAACLRDAGCPPGWVQLSTSGPSGRPIYVVAELERAEVARILRGMSLAPR